MFRFFILTAISPPPSESSSRVFPSNAQPNPPVSSAPSDPRANRSGRYHPYQQQQQQQQRQPLQPLERGGPGPVKSHHQGGGPPRSFNQRQGPPVIPNGGNAFRPAQAAVRR